PREFIVNSLKSIPNPSSNATAIDFGAGVGHETLLLLQKGYKVLAIDNQKSALNILLNRKDIKPYQNHIQTYESSFEKLNLKNNSKSDIVIASFALAFCKPKQFKQFWQQVTENIKPGGYFIGNTFDPGFTAFDKKDHDNMTFHTKNETIKLFDDFEILTLNEIKKEATISGKFDHYYEIVARKK
ncbi:class I SAM-dependent methyltransferase, partial [Legionella sp. km535]|uniref:class I SAM-dependent methyltransferase n=1 Tax=Legionella sp. km535 TaxID=2498107 RepID=UPI000F94D466